MLDASRHDNELALLHPFGRLVAELHTKTALDYEKEFVLMIMMMKHELAFDLIQLDLLPIQVGGNVGLPVFGDFGELFRDVDFRHYFSLHRPVRFGGTRKVAEVSKKRGRVVRVCVVKNEGG